MRKNTLYTVNPWNKAMFYGATPRRVKYEEPKFANVDRLTHNIFDGFDASQLSVGGASVLDSSLNTDAIKNSVTNTAIKGFASSAPKGLTGIKGLSAIGKGNPLAGGAMNMIGSAVGNAGYKLLSNGLNSGAGAAVNKIGGAVGGIVGKANPLLGTAITAAAGLIGGGINALGGTAVDQEKLQKAKEGTTKLNNFTSNADNFDAIKSITSTVENVQDAYRGGALKKGWAARHNAAIRKQRADGIAWGDRSIANNVDNLIADQNNAALGSFIAAYGGLLPRKNKRIKYGRNRL